MPLPSPRGSQSKDEFISSCMGSDVMNKEYPDGKQRAAVCFSQWRRTKKDSKSEEEKASWDECEELIIKKHLIYTPEGIRIVLSGSI